MGLEDLEAALADDEDDHEEDEDEDEHEDSEDDSESEDFDPLADLGRCSDAAWVRELRWFLSTFYRLAPVDEVNLNRADACLGAMSWDLRRLAAECINAGSPSVQVHIALRRVLFVHGKVYAWWLQVNDDINGLHPDALRKYHSSLDHIWRRTPEGLAYEKLRLGIVKAKPAYRERQRAYRKERDATPEAKARRATPEYREQQRAAARARRAARRAEAQGDPAEAQDEPTSPGIVEGVER